MKLLFSKRILWLLPAVSILLATVLSSDVFVRSGNALGLGAFDINEGKRLASTFVGNVAGLNLSGRASNVEWWERIGDMNEMRVTVENGSRFLYATVFFDHRGRLSGYGLDSSSVPMEGNETLGNCLVVASHAISEYMMLFNATYVDSFSQMLAQAIQSQNSTVENDDALLAISQPGYYSDFVTLEWYRKIANQFTSVYQSISIEVSRGGLLTQFDDYVGTFTVADVGISVSEADVMNISRPYAEADAQQRGFNITRETATLTWERGSDLNRSSWPDYCWTLYPAWTYRASFSVPSQSLGTYGYAVLISADTGQIISQGPSDFWGNVPSSGSKDNTYVWAVIAITVSVVILTCLGTYRRRRKRGKIG